MFRISGFIMGIIIGASCLFAQAPLGWSCFAGVDGNIYRCRSSGTPEKIYAKQDALHARWSVDGGTIFFLLKNGEIWAMNGNGDNPRKVGMGKVSASGGCPLAAYRPLSGTVLSVEDGKFYSLSLSGEKKQICQSSMTFYGETAISADGLRIAVRAGSSNYKITVDPTKPAVNVTPVQYSAGGSASISPDGQWLIWNEHDHKYLAVYHWSDAAKNKRIANTSAWTWDNQTFAANSGEWISVLFDEMGTNKGTKIGIVNFNDASKIYKICDISGTQTSYPDFFLGELPTVGIRPDMPSYKREKALVPYHPVARVSFLESPVCGNALTKWHNLKGVRLMSPNHQGGREGVKAGHGTSGATLIIGSP